MAAAAVAGLLGEVSEIQESYVDDISGAENEFEQLKTELSLLKDLLDDAANKPEEERLSKIMQWPIFHFVYDAEDTIESSLNQKAKNQLRRVRDKRPVNVAKEVKSIRDKLKPILDEAKRRAKL